MLLIELGICFVEVGYLGFLDTVNELLILVVEVTEEGFYLMFLSFFSSKEFESPVLQLFIVDAVL